MLVLRSPVLMLLRLPMSAPPGRVPAPGRFAMPPAPPTPSTRPAPPIPPAPPGRLVMPPPPPKLDGGVGDEGRFAMPPPPPKPPPPDGRLTLGRALERT